MVLSAFGVVSVIFGGVVLPAVFIAVIVAAFAVKVDLVDAETFGDAVFKSHHHPAGEQIAVGDFAFSGGSVAHFAFAGHGTGKFQIAFVFIFETALQSAADSGDGAGGEGEILFFCHADVDGVELFEEAAAAQRAAADGDAAEDAGFDQQHHG